MKTYWKFWEALEPDYTIYGQGENPKRLERLKIYSDADGHYFTRTIPAGKIGADGDITRIWFPLSLDPNNRTRYQRAQGGVKLNITSKMVGEMVGIKSGFVLATNEAEALNVVDDSGQIILMAGEPKNGKFTLWFTGYYEHIAPKNEKGRYPLTKVDMLTPDGTPAYFSPDKWIEVVVNAHMNTFQEDGTPNNDALCEVIGYEDGQEIGRAVLDNFRIADLPGSGWDRCEWVCFSGGEGDQYRFSQSADIHFRDHWFEADPEEVAEPEPEEPGQTEPDPDERDKLIAELRDLITEQDGTINTLQNEVNLLKGEVATLRADSENLHTVRSILNHDPR